MRAMLLAILLAVALPDGARAQCCGDCGGDGEVSIADLIVAVTNSLNGCDVTTPTVGPSSTPTRNPTATRTPNDRCPRDFTDTNNQCTFSGRYNNGCGAVVNASFQTNGTTVIVNVTTGIANPALVRFAATRQTASRANLSGWSVNDFQTVNPVAGRVEINEGGAELVVFPNDPPFMINGCNFVQFVGAYNPRQAAAAATADDGALPHLQAWQARTPPEIAEP